MKNKFAFTLAEVLITLVIIGVVAALTIPTAIAKYREQEIRSKLNKAYSTLTNGIRLSEVVNGPFGTWPTPAELGNMETYWNRYFAPFFNGARLCSNSLNCGYKSDISYTKWQDAGWNIFTDYGGKSRMLFQLGDGAVVFYPFSTGGSSTTVLFVDANGTKEPNTMNKDVFLFVRSNTQNTIIPSYNTTQYLIKK